MSHRRLKTALYMDDQDGYSDQPWLACCFNCAGSRGEGKLCFWRRQSDDGRFRRVWPSSICNRFENIRKEWR